MTEISLRDYCGRIEEIIDQGRYVEAIAHGKQVLGYYPRYVPAYRLLGSALLEAGQDEYAEDMFLGVLSSDPEDYLAWAATSEVYERRGELENAIWSMERAFDLASDNVVLTEHLLELRGRRDGVMEARVDLTRAALGRLYIRGNLLSRAIREFTALVADNPNRPDLVLALAEAYWRDDERVEASDLCQRVLTELPFCLKANLILGDIWRETGRDEAALYFRRARTLDPENRVARALLGPSGGDVQEVTVPFLEYGGESEAEQPAWMQEVSTAEEPSGEKGLIDVKSMLEAKIEIPSWLDTSEVGGGGAEAPPAEKTEEGDIAEAVDDIEEIRVDGVTEAEPIESMAAPAIPSEPAAVVEPEVETMPVDEVPEWLAGLTGGAGDGQPGASDLIAWDTTDRGSAVEGDLGSETEGTPSWLPSSEPVSEREEAEEADRAPEWIAEPSPPESGELPPGEGLPATEEVFGPELEQAADMVTPEPAEIPDWLAALAPRELEGTVALPETDEGSNEGRAQNAKPEEMPAWLSALSAGHALPAEDVPGVGLVEGEAQADMVMEENLAEVVPDWLESAKPELTAESDAATDARTAGEESEGKSDAGGEIPEWLAGLAAQSAGGEQVPESVEDIPEWIAQVRPHAQNEGVGAESDTSSEMVDWLGDGGLGASGDSPARVEQVVPDTVEERVSAAQTEVGGEVGGELDSSNASVTGWVAGEQMPSGDETLARLKQLTAVQEDELRTEIVAEGEAPMSDIVGRPQASLPESADGQVLTEAEEEFPTAEVASLPEPDVRAFGWTSMGTGPLGGSVAVGPVGGQPAATTKTEQTVDRSIAPEEETGISFSAGDVPETVVSPPVPQELEIDLGLTDADEVGDIGVGDGQQFPGVATGNREDQPVDIELAWEAEAEAAVVEAQHREDKQVEPEADLPAETRLRVDNDRRDYDEQLVIARGLWESGERDESLDAYEHLIKAGDQMEHIVKDLQELMSMWPTARVGRTLGDAYMKEGRVQDALEIYRRALNNL